MSSLSKLNMSSNAGNEYTYLLYQLDREYNISSDFRSSLESYTDLIFRAVDLLESSDDEDRFSKPMPWIGIYIALASLFCVLAMSCDLIHGFRNRKLWFPSKYFTLNAVSLTVIAVAMKLPVDLNTSMPGSVDLGAKLGSMAFMCTMMANFLPSLAAMDNKELLTNIIALVILVITLVVNVCIQIKTGVVFQGDSSSFVGYYTWVIAIVYVVSLLVLLMIHISTSLAILKSKQILESKYQEGHQTALIEFQQSGRVLTVEKLKRHVTNHWIMAGTSSPQFITACSATTSASGVICVLSAIIHVITFIYTCQYLFDYRSGYKWSTLVILMVQFLGVVLGSISPLCRCFASLSFKLSIKWIWNSINVFKVENYWIQKLCDWKQSSIAFSISNRKQKTLFQFFKIRMLNFCIGCQKTVVVACKMIALIPIFFVIFVLFCLRFWKWLTGVFGATKKTMRIEHNKDLQLYVLQLQDDMEVAQRTLKMILNSVDILIKKAEKKQPDNLMKLLEGSNAFEGVKLFDNHHVPCILSEDACNGWSLPLVTLTSIAISLPNIQNDIVDSLLSSVNEGLVYVTLVEEILNSTDEYITIQKAAKNLWLEVEVDHNWLNNKLKNPDARLNTSGQILHWLKDTAKNMVYSETYDNSFYTTICANSMYRITETILLFYNTKIEHVSQEELFLKLSSMIADIMAACLTNLPQVIAMKCHESAIEKREASVQAAAQLLGETTLIINSLQARELPGLNPDELPFIDKWRDYLTHPSP